MNISQALPWRTHWVEETGRKAAGDTEQTRRVEGRQDERTSQLELRALVLQCVHKDHLRSVGSMKDPEGSPGELKNENRCTPAKCFCLSRF